ncbi:MAG: DNA gyrase inhibitor YacG, partial [Phycisphaerae bacterium]
VLTVARRVDAPFRPFCSHRCKLVDLGRWFDGTYRISEPVDEQALPQPTDPEDSDEPADSRIERSDPPTDQLREPD